MEPIVKDSDIIYTLDNNFIKKIKQEYLSKKLLILTSKGCIKRGFLSTVQLSSSSFQNIEICDMVNDVPDHVQMNAILKFAKQFDPDLIVAIGGGSCVDAAKLLAAGLNESITSSECYIDTCNTTQPHTANINIVNLLTMIGSGAECTPFATLWDKSNKKKYSVATKNLKEVKNIYCLEFIGSADVHQLLNGSLDSLTHLFDSIWNKNVTNLTKKTCLDKINLLIKLAIKLSNGESLNLNDIDTFIKCSSYAGFVIASTKTSICHAISYRLTLNYGIPHGYAAFYSVPFVFTYLRNEYAHLEIFQSNNCVMELNNNLIELWGADRIQNYYSRIDIEELLKDCDDIVSNDRAKNFIVTPTVSLLVGIMNNTLQILQSRKN